MDETDAQQQPYWSKLEEISRPARERRRLPPEVRSQIIVHLCAVAPLSVKDLSILLDRSEAYVGDAIRPLVTTRELTFLYPDQPRHPRQKYVAGRQQMGGAPSIPIDIPEIVETLPAGFDDSAAYPVLDEEARPANELRPHAPIPSRAPDVEPPPAAFPNQATNVVFVAVIGVILGVASVSWWWAWALLAAVALASLHVIRDSVQLRQFTSLRFVRSKRTGFLILKALVAFAEIALVFVIVRAVLGGD